MPYAWISENYQSRSFTVGSTQVRERVYDLSGTDDEEEVRQALVDTSPTIDSGLLRDSISAEPLGNGVWKGYVRYAGLDADSEFTFDTSGATSKITQALGTVGNYAPIGQVPPNFYGAIGVTDDRVEGTEVPASKYEFTETHRFLRTQVDLEYRLVLYNMTGRWNHEPFRGFAAGEVMFLGAFGSIRGDDLWAITYKFACSPNAFNIPIGGVIDGPYDDPYDELILVPAKLGWDYLWIRYADFEDADAATLVKRPTSAHVERVSYPGDFELLGIGTDPLDAP